MNLQAKIDMLPASIWIPGDTEPSIYRGTPTEIVNAMAVEMGGGFSLRDTVARLCSALAQNRRIGIHIPLDLPDEQLAGLFVYALLDTKLARPMASA